MDRRRSRRGSSRRGSGSQRVGGAAEQGRDAGRRSETGLKFLHQVLKGAVGGLTGGPGCGLLVPKRRFAIAQKVRASGVPLLPVNFALAQRTTATRAFRFGTSLHGSGEGVNRGGDYEMFSFGTSLLWAIRGRRFKLISPQVIQYEARGILGTGLQERCKFLTRIFRFGAVNEPFGSHSPEGRSYFS